MYPKKSEAEKILQEAFLCNPGPWKSHCRVVARAAELIAEKCGMDSEKAYVVGLLHDIGRRFGKRHMGHVYHGYTYMTELGFDEAARVCLSHSFNTEIYSEFIGKVDTTEEESAVVMNALEKLQMDDYDRLIQLCDSFCIAEGPVSLEERMGDIKKRYGCYPQGQWDKNIELKEYFSRKMGMDLYELMDSSFPKTEPPEFRKASEGDAEVVCGIIQESIRAVCPKYYVPGIVEFLCSIYCLERISSDIAGGKVCVLVAKDGTVLGTGTVDGNRIESLFVAPEFQGNGHGSFIIRQLESGISSVHSSAVVNALLPAFHLFEVQGYGTVSHTKFLTPGGDILVSEVMEKKLK